MKIAKPIVVVFQILIISAHLLPFNQMKSYSNDLTEIQPFVDDNISQIQGIPEIGGFVSYPSSQDTWNEVSDSNIDREFELSETINETVSQLTIENCSDWSVDSDFNFTNIRSEKIVNGDAESTEQLWTDYIPSHYNGNITRENSPPNGEVISDEYSWYFDIQTDNHSTIVGFDDPLDVSSDSVIFSFSYSLIRNNLGTIYDSNICIRLFFQFDIYIFISFTGNIGVLSNVTGPGGYADLVVNQAEFDGDIHDYSLNVTALGLELFDQKPDQLRSLAVQTWGELPYQMEFIIDDISLTDQISPSSINLEVNSNSVTGLIGKGSTSFVESPSSSIDFTITSTYLEDILWDCSYRLKGLGQTTSYRTCEFENWNQVNWFETVNYTFNLPTSITDFTFYKWIPIDWTLNEILVDDIPVSYIIDSTNITYQRIVFASSIFNSIQLQYFSNNKVDNVLLSDYSITHDDELTVSLESTISNREVNLVIMNSNDEIIYYSTNYTEISGNCLFSNIVFDSNLSPDSYSVIIFWNLNNEIGIGERTLEIISYPSIVLPSEATIQANYKQSFLIEVSYKDCELDLPIDFATVTYNWSFGSGVLQQHINNKYFIEIPNSDVNPGFYTINVLCSRSGYASAAASITIEIIFSDFNLILDGPSIAIPGGSISASAQILDNDSSPVPDMEVRFKINNQPYSDTWTNTTGFANIFYFISPTYEFETLNLSCSIIIDQIEFLQSGLTIQIDLFESPRLVSLGEPNQYSTTNDSAYFTFQVIYPTIGKNWYVNTPTNFDPIDAIILTDSTNISTTISPIGIITWTKEINNLTNNNDVLLLELDKPQPSYQVESSKNSITIEITIETKSIPYNGLEIIISRNNDWQSYDEWNLYQNTTLVSDVCNLVISEDVISFKIFTTEQTDKLTFHLEGTETSLIQISASTIILGVGTTILTIVSTVLLFRKKSNISLDIQI